MPTATLKFDLGEIPQLEPVLTVAEFAAARLTTAGVYGLIRKGVIKPIRIGAAVRISEAEARRVLAGTE